MLRSLFVGLTLKDVCGRVDECVKEYNSALDDLGLLATMETRQHGKMIYSAVEELSSNIEKMSFKMDALQSMSSIDLSLGASREYLGF